MEIEERIVLYDTHCVTCQYNDIPETEEPCNRCMDEPVNLYTDRPVEWKEKKDGKTVKSQKR